MISTPHRISAFVFPYPQPLVFCGVEAEWDCLIHALSLLLNRSTKIYSSQPSLDIVFKESTIAPLKPIVGGVSTVKPGKNSIFLKNGKTVISVENLEFF